MFDLEPDLDTFPTEDNSNWIRAISAEERSSLARRFLEFHLFRIEPGEALPSIRTIRQKCGIGPNQVQMLIGELEGRGLVERRDRMGVFKVDSSQDDQMITSIDFLSCARIDALRGSPFQSELMHCLSEKVDEQLGCNLRLRQVWASQNVQSYEKLASDPQMRAVILASSPLRGISDIFVRHNIAVIELLPVYPTVDNVEVPTITGPRNVVSLQLEHLFSLGHRKIAYMENMDPRAPSWQMMCRREEFFRTMLKHGCQLDPSLVFYPGTNYSEACKTLEEKFAGDDLPTAFITYDCHLNAFFKWAEGRKLRIGKDISVVSTNDMPQASQMSPAVTSLRISRDRIAELSLEALKSVIQGKGQPKLIEAQAELIVRDSTGPAPQ